ncbi:MAG: sulfite exporter TauE/SafE family protein [Planctomycetota bacterium]
MDAATVLLLLAGGLAAGFVNTVAGGGSVITLPILMGVAGLPATVANGTNRIAILLQNVAAVGGYRRGGVLHVRGVLPVLPPVLVGAVGGAWTATQIDPRTMRTLFAFVIVLVAVSVVVRAVPRPARAAQELAGSPEPWRSLLFLGIGFYGGFVQAGVGFLLLAGLVLGGGFDLVRSNAAKVLLVLLYTPLTLLLFAQAQHVAWVPGLVMAGGSITGALIASTLAVRKGSTWIRWVLLVAAVAAAARMLTA